MEFILWLHILIANPLGGFTSDGVQAHPVRFASYHECEQAGQRWEAERIAELQNKRYAIVYQCESHERRVPRSSRAHFSNMI